MGILSNASLLLREAQGFRSKVTVCRYLMRGISQRIVRPPMGKVSAASNNGEFQARFKYATLLFRSSELTPYLEIFNEQEYDFAFDLRPDEVVIDAGANIGLFAIYCTRRFGPLRMYAFEPAPDPYGRLLRNLIANSADNVIAENAALFSVGGTVCLRPNARTTESTLSNEDTADTLRVTAVSLDDFAYSRAITNVGLMKIDVEGAELEVLRGAANLLGATRQIVVECHSATLCMDVTAFLTGRDFIEVGKKVAGARDHRMIAFRRSTHPRNTAAATAN
jgi:FkbM family methyltransferase